MDHKLKRYTSDEIDVTYEVKRCIHAAECVHGLSAVFDTAKRPWIQPANASADRVAEIVERCPTGALHYELRDGGQPEAIPDENRIVVTAGGPYYVRGDVQIEIGGETRQDTRLALCRCGQSANKPYCDNAHKEAGFRDNGQIAEARIDDRDRSGRLTIKPSKNGPLLLRGNFELVSSDGQTVYRGQKTALCRCGGSANKPFCDGTHRRNGFQSESR